MSNESVETGYMLFVLLVIYFVIDIVLTYSSSKKKNKPSLSLAVFFSISRMMIFGLILSFIFFANDPL
jgi:NADH:ubiquinone oxidoreductase subunit 3 (subunit A)